MSIRILVSAVPLVVAAVFAHGESLSGPHPCISVGDTSVQIADMPGQAALHVSFTDDPALATVRVQIAETAEGADFAMVDDGGNSEGGACAANAATRLVAISAGPGGNAPVIYLSADGPADYRIFVRSKSFTAREAAALVVGAGDGHHRLTAASL